MSKKDRWLKKEEGGHDYGPNFPTSNTKECQFGCGCEMAQWSSGYPDGVDPFGLCPKNPENKSGGPFKPPEKSLPEQARQSLGLPSRDDIWETLYGNNPP